MVTNPSYFHALYVYRLLLTGIHLMRTGQVEANRIRLNKTAKLPNASELIARKLAGPEKGRLDQADLEFHLREYQRSTAEPERSFEHSRLPEKRRHLRARSGRSLRKFLSCVC
jgi:hypothetical protein